MLSAQYIQMDCASNVSLRKVLEWHIASPWESLIQSPTDGFHPAFTDGKSDNGADDNTADAPESNTFKKHPVAKKWHRRHLFLVQYPGRYCR